MSIREEIAPNQLNALKQLNDVSSSAYYPNWIINRQGYRRTVFILNVPDQKAVPLLNAGLETIGITTEISYTSKSLLIDVKKLPELTRERLSQTRDLLAAHSPAYILAKRLERLNKVLRALALPDGQSFAFSPSFPGRGVAQVNLKTSKTVIEDVIGVFSRAGIPARPREYQDVITVSEKALGTITDQNMGNALKEIGLKRKAASRLQTCNA